MMTRVRPYPNSLRGLLDSLSPSMRMDDWAKAISNWSRRKALLDAIDVCNKVGAEWEETYPVNSAVAVPTNGCNDSVAAIRELVRKVK